MSPNLEASSGRGAAREPAAVGVAQGVVTANPKFGFLPKFHYSPRTEESAKKSKGLRSIAEAFVFQPCALGALLRLTKTKVQTDSTPCRSSAWRSTVDAFDS